MMTGYFKITKGYQKRKLRRRIVVVTLMTILCLLATITMLYGNTVYSVNTVFRVLAGEEIQGAAFAIKTLRFPRMLGAILVGFSFGMSGYVFQCVLRNPLASPDIIGVSSATSFVAVFCILFLHLENRFVSIYAVLAGIIVALVIYLLSCKGGFSHGKMILIGIGIQAMLRAATSFLLIKASEYDVASTLQWLSGSLNNVRMDKIPRLLITVIIAGTILLILSRHLEAIQLGDSYAVTLGVNIKIIYVVLIVCSVCLVAFSTSVTGPIASVAFLSGPIATRLSGQGRSNLFVAGLVGAVLVLSSDFIGQFAFVTRYPVGVISGILGAPYLLYLLVRMNQKGDSV